MYSLRLLYHSLVYSILTYCNTVLGNCGATQIGSLYNTQKKLVGALSFRGRYDHTAQLFRKFNLLTIYHISSYMSALFVHTIVSHCRMKVTDFSIFIIVSTITSDGTTLIH